MSNKPIGNTWNLFNAFFGFKVKAHINALEELMNTINICFYIEPEICGKMQLHLNDWKAFYKRWIMECGPCPMTNFAQFSENPKSALADIIHSSTIAFKSYLLIRITNHDYEECRDECNSAILEYNMKNN